MDFDKITFVDLLVACRTHDPAWLSLSYGLSGNEFEELHNVVKGPESVAKGEFVYQRGERCEALYALQSGSSKSYLIGANGNEQVTGFRFRGDLLGLDALRNGTYHCSAVALEASNIFRLPTERLEEITAKVAGLQRELIRVMSGRIGENEEHMLLLSQRSAPVRFATWLSTLGQRERENGGTVDEIPLTMSYQDLANFLGLTSETVSRLLRRFCDDGLIATSQRRLRLLDRKRIFEMAESGQGSGRHGHRQAP